MEKLEEELNRWRSGETVKPEEQVDLNDLSDANTPVSGMEESTIAEKPSGTFLNFASNNTCYNYSCSRTTSSYAFLNDWFDFRHRREEQIRN